MQRSRSRWGWVLGGMASVFALVGPALAADPFASNFGVYPPAGSNPPPFDGPYTFRKLSHDYPTQPPAQSWLDVKPKGRITVDNAGDYMARLKKYVAASVRNMIEAPAKWDPGSNGWYDMPWMGEMDRPLDYDSGRDPIIGSFTGQIILAKSEHQGTLKADTENHTIVYYDRMSATMLGKIWKDVHSPDIKAATFPEGGLVVKAGGVAATPADWPVVDGAAVWRVYRPPLQEIIDHRYNGSTKDFTLQVTDLRVMQFDIIVKDTDASPDTGWVFTTFVYDKDAPKGTGPWDQMVPLGATWGNDPEFNRLPEGHPPSDPKNPAASTLKQFWRNPNGPIYTAATLGWGERMSGPIDIAKRHGVILVEGVEPGQLTTDAACQTAPQHVDVPGSFRASGCFSCHGTSQSTSPARMYPSPIADHLPPDGNPFCLYTPGGNHWAEWYMNRRGSDPQLPKKSIHAAAVAVSANSLAAIPYLRLAPNPSKPVDLGAVQRAVSEAPRGLDYDMLLMFAVGNAQLTTQGFTLLPRRTPVH
jgi:hypothetical protein